MRSLLALEANMDSTIIAVRENVEELAAHAPRPSEVHLKSDRSHSNPLTWFLLVDKSLLCSPGDI